MFLAIIRYKNNGTYLEIVQEIAIDPLVERCRTGDRTAYYAVYRQYSKAMLSSSMRILNNLADAEDVVQEAFVDAFKNLDRFTYKSRFEAWLRRIVINKSINLIRKRKVYFSDIDSTNLSSLKEDEFDEEQWDYNIEQIKKAIAQLPDRHRIIFNLYAVDGIPQEEIALMLKLSHNNVRTLYHRAKKKIMEFINYEQKR